LLRRWWINNLICFHLNILFIDWFLLHWCSPSVGSRSYSRTLVDMFNILCRNRSQLTNWNLISSSSWSKLPDRRYTLIIVIVVVWLNSSHIHLIS
jgi:hypothetical protein